jgi:hypothetical protein
MRMLSKHRDSRFPRARDAAAALQDYLHENNREGSQQAVASLVQTVLGEQLRARTADLTPSQPNFLISFSGRQKTASQVLDASASADTASAGVFEAGTVTSPRPLDPRALSSVPPAAVPAAAAPGRALAFGLAGLLLAVLAGGLWMIRQGLDRPAPIPPLEPAPLIADPSPPPATIEDLELPTGDAEAEIPEDLELDDGPEDEVPLAAPRRSRPARRRERPRPPVVEKVAPAPEPREDGFLTLKTTPWAKISIAGAPYGSTPVFKLRLSPGRHVLHLVNEEAGVDVKRTVTIKSGETAKLDINLKR